MKIWIILMALFAQLASCNARLHQTAVHVEPLAFDTIRPAAGLAASSTRFQLPYRLSEPDDRFELPQILKEISGLGMNEKQPDLVTAIQDEDGKLFYINKSTGEVESEVTFYKNGDYEGVEVVGDAVYVVKSTGTIYEVKHLEQTPPLVRKHKFFLSKENDVEGLCYDAGGNRLLIACKGLPATGESLEMARFKKEIYSFDLAEKRMELVPAFTIRLKDIQQYLQTCEATKDHDKLCKYFEPEVENLIFNPSAIAIHPLTGHFYMTSSSKKIMMVFDEKGQILHLEKMDKSVHPQPEGIAFDEEGTLYMANEGKKEGAGTLLRFNYRPANVRE